jgi:hypothetical protein
VLPEANFGSTGYHPITPVAFTTHLSRKNNHRKLVTVAAAHGYAIADIGLAVDTIITIRGVS